MLQWWPSCNSSRESTTDFITIVQLVHFYYKFQDNHPFNDELVALEIKLCALNCTYSKNPTWRIFDLFQTPEISLINVPVDCSWIFLIVVRSVKFPSRDRTGTTVAISAMGTKSHQGLHHSTSAPVPPRRSLWFKFSSLTHPSCFQL